ncbi:MAG: VOC family protein [Alphaproteobacteria bacterium]
MKEWQVGNQHNAINYIEFPLIENANTKQFYSEVFGWKFTDWGPTYISFSGAGIDGGFNGEDNPSASKPGVLVVLYADDLAQKLTDVEAAGGEIVRPIYQFPGGSRFHFIDPNGIELAVWSP